MKLVSLIAFLLLMQSCNSTSPGIIERDKMELILFDYISADVYSKEKLIDSTKEDTIVGIKLQDAVFKKYNVTRQEFENSFAYYSKDLDQFKNLLDSTVAKAQRADSSFINKGIVPKPIQDL